MSNIMPEPGQHGWAELLTLVDAIHNVAYNPGLRPTTRCVASVTFLDYDHLRVVMIDDLPRHCDVANGGRLHPLSVVGCSMNHSTSSSQRPSSANLRMNRLS